VLSLAKRLENNHRESRQVRPNTRHTRPHSGDRAGTTHTRALLHKVERKRRELWRGWVPAGGTVASCIVPGGVRWHRKEWWVGTTVGWVGFVPQPRGRSMLFAAGLPPKQSSCFCIDLEINVQ
jgi:hypothetical protein